MGDIIFRTYDRAALDREYDNQAKVPAWPQIRADMEADSAAVRAGVPCRLDLAYGPHPREVLDVFLPSGGGGGPAPVHVFIHGGYWQRNDKAGSSYVAGPLVAAGAVAVVINYPLIPSVTMDQLVVSCRAAVAWVYRNALSLGGDPSRLTVSGHSAGGHLAAMLLATDWAALGLPSGVVRAACGISGLYDLEPVRLCFVNEVMQLDEAAVRRNSLVLLPAPSSGRLLLAVGGAEGPEFHRQVEALAGAWRPSGLPVDVLGLPGYDHFTMAAQFGDRASVLTHAIVGLLG